MERRLAAILVADIVGYSRLMGRDEERTLRAVMHLRSELIEPLVATHRGRLVKQTGDGFLIEFASAMNAIQCALQWQARAASDSEGEGDEILPAAMSWGRVASILRTLRAFSCAAISGCNRL